MLKRILQWLVQLFTKQRQYSNDNVKDTTESIQEKESEKQTQNTNTMTKGQQVVEIARKEIGNTEFPDSSNLTKYGEWFGLNAEPWCAIFVSWCFAASGLPLEPIGFKKGFAGVQTGVDHFKKTNQLTKVPITGDIVCFDWQVDGHFDHTGIFVRNIDDNTFESIEGNTSLGNQSNGGQVMLRIRHYSNAIFVHPNILG